MLGQTDRALDHLRRAAALDPTLAQVPNSLGLIAFDQGRRDEAEAAYREAILSIPSSQPPASISPTSTMPAIVKPRRPPLRLALKLEPDNLIALVTLGKVFCNIGDPDLLEEAEVLCRRATALAPQFPPAFESLGNVLRTRQRHSEAIASYEQAAKLDPRRGMPYHYIGENFQKLGNHDEACAGLCPGERPRAE